MLVKGEGANDRSLRSTTNLQSQTGPEPPGHTRTRCVGIPPLNVLQDMSDFFKTIWIGSDRLRFILEERTNRDSGPGGSVCSQKTCEAAAPPTAGGKVVEEAGSVLIPAQHQGSGVDANPVTEPMFVCLPSSGTGSVNQVPSVDP